MSLAFSSHPPSSGPIGTTLDLRISSIDSLIVVSYVLVTLGLGLWFGRGSNTLQRFLVGDRNLPWWVVLGSIVATETSAVTFLSVPGLSWVEGGDFGFLQLAIGLVLGRWIVVVWFLPSYFSGEVFTAYDILQRRFGRLTQRTASLIFIVTRTLADGLRLYLTALVLGQVSGFDLTLCVLIMGVATVVYSAIGGIRSVVWNDCIQLVVYLIGAVVAIGVIVAALPGGWQELWQFGQSTGRFRVFEDAPFAWNQANLWAGMVGGIFISLATHGTDQLMVQRYLCSRSLGEARLAVGLSGPLVAAQFALFLLVGVALAAWTSLLPQPPELGRDEVFAAFIVNHMPVGLCGLTLAAVFSVAMSTLSSSLSSSASAVVNDFLRPPRREGVSAATTEAATAEAAALEGESAEAIDRRLTRAGKLWTTIFGVLQMGVAILVIEFPALVAASVVHQVITVAGFASGLIVGIFLLGRSRRRFAQRSGLIGMVTAFFVTIALINPPDWLAWKLHGWWAALVASLVCYSVASIVDRLFPRAHEASHE